MIEFLLGILFAWYFIPTLLFIDYFCIRGEAFGWSIFFTLVILILLYFTYAIPLIYIVGFIVLYIPIGIWWSILKFDNYCKNLSQRSNVSNYEFNISRHTDKIVGWIIVWPLSMLDHSLGWIVDYIEFLVKEKLGSIYIKISNKYIQ